MKIKVNGEDKEVADGLTVAALLQSLEVAPELVAVEVNLDIIARGDRDQAVLKADDEVEIVKFVGGGSL